MPRHRCKEKPAADIATGSNFNRSALCLLAHNHPKDDQQNDRPDNGDDDAAEVYPVDAADPDQAADKSANRPGLHLACCRCEVTPR